MNMGRGLTCTCTEPAHSASVSSIEHKTTQILLFYIQYIHAVPYICVLCTLDAVPQRLGANDDLALLSVLPERHEQSLLQLHCSV